MIKGKLKVKLDEKKIEEILPFAKYEKPSDCIILINKWAIPHWNEVKSISYNSITINKTTTEAIINRMKLINNDNNKNIRMSWLIYGWSLNENLGDWKCEINFYKINYKDECF